MKQYRITSGNPLIIERTPEAHEDTVAYLEARSGSSVGRTNATKAGFDLSKTEDGGQGWTGLVYFDGLRRATYRSAIELPVGHLSEPEAYHPPWPWNEVEVFRQPIEVTDGSVRRRKKPKPEPDAEN